MPVLTDDQFANKYFQYVVVIHLAQQKKLKGLKDENYRRSLDNPPGEQVNVFEIKRKIKLCDDKFGDISKLYIDSQRGIIRANPIVFSRFTLISAYLDYLRTATEIFGGTEWREEWYNYAKIRKFFLYNLPMKEVIEGAIETIDEIAGTLSQDIDKTTNDQIYDLNDDFIGSGNHHQLLACIQNQINLQNINYVQGRAFFLDWKWLKIKTDDESKEDKMSVNYQSPAKMSNYENLKHWEKELISPILIFQIVVLYYNRVRKFRTDNNLDDSSDDLPSIYYLALKP